MRINGTGTTRRRVLTTSAIAGAGSLLSGCVRCPGAWSWLTPPADPGTVGVDAHCHVFNGRDIPARGFARAILENDPATQGSPLLPIVVDLIVEVIRTFAPTSHAELCALKSMLGEPCGDIHIHAEPEETAEFELDAGKLSGYLETIALTSAVMSIYSTQDRAAALTLLLKVQRLFVFMQRLGSGRHANTRRLIRSFGDRADGIHLFTPALVDFDDSFEFSSDPPVHHDTQVAILECLSRIHRGQVHGFVGYNPLHDTADPDNGPAITRVRDAVSQRGFLGVKLYPPMGFAPTGNGSNDPADCRSIVVHPKKAKLDAPLLALFRYCVAEGVPVMAHCNDSNGSRPPYGCLAAPAYWAELFQVHADLRELRLGLAHFGGLDLSAAGSWTRDVIALMRGCPNVYADAGHFEGICGAFGERFQADLLALPEADRRLVAERFVHGTDWFMPLDSEEHDGYLAALRAIVGASLGGAAVTRVMGENAARFLGLASGQKTRDRIDGFYAKHGIADPEWMIRVDAAAT